MISCTAARGTYSRSSHLRIDATFHERDSSGFLARVNYAATDGSRGGPSFQATTPKPSGLHTILVARPLRQAATSFGAAAVVLSAAAGGPTLAADLVLGQETFNNSCAVCHTGGLNNIAGEEKHTLKEDALRKYNLFSVEAITHQVNVGKEAMPPFQGVLSEEEIAAVAEYVFDQAKGDKW